jgi:hypothetical protein
MELNHTKNNNKIFFILWILCVIGALSVLPHIRYMGVLTTTASIGKMVFLTALQNALFFGLICWLSFKILPKTDLRPFRLENGLKTIAFPAVISGLLVGGVLIFLDRTVFHSSSLSGLPTPLWAGVLASMYGAVNEEVLMRLFLFTLLYFLFGKVIKISLSNRWALLWSVNVLVALFFGLGHLPAAFKVTSPSAFEIVRILLLNGIAGVVFGWLYWSRGLWAAILAHYLADLVLVCSNYWINS